MTRIPYDQTAKQLLDGALERAGRAEAQHEVSNDPRWLDVWFERDETKPLPPGLSASWSRSRARSRCSTAR